jgi:hypothetical protein
MWKTTNPDFIGAILAELAKRGPLGFDELWNAIHQNGVMSKATFNEYLRMLVNQGLVKHIGHRRLPSGRWITVRRGRYAKYSLAKNSPISADAKPIEVRQWVETNLSRARTDLLNATEHCVQGIGDWREIYANFEKTMRLNLELWWNNKERISTIANELVAELEHEKRQLGKPTSFT